MRKYTLFYIIWLFVLPLNLSSQEEEMSGEMSPAQQLLEIIAHSYDIPDKMNALQRIEGFIDRGEAELIDSTLAILHNLALESTGWIVTIDGVYPENDFPNVRREACRVLGKVDKRASIETLVSVLQYESEPMVLSEAIVSLAGLSVENDPFVMRKMALAMRTMRTSNPDNNFAMAFLTAVEIVMRKNAAIVTGDSILLGEVITLSKIQSGFLKPVYHKANEIITQILDSL